MHFHTPVFSTQGRTVTLRASVDHDKGTTQVQLGTVRFAPDFGLMFEPNPQSFLPSKALIAARGWLHQHRNELLDLIDGTLDPNLKGDQACLAAIAAEREQPTRIPDEMLQTLLGNPAPATEPELAALRRLLSVAQRETGQSERCAAFLLAWWNATECGGFDFTDLWAVDTALAMDMVTVTGLIARHRHYPDKYLDKTAMKALVRQWRPALFQNKT